MLKHPIRLPTKFSVVFGGLCKPCCGIGMHGYVALSLRHNREENDLSDKNRHFMQSLVSHIGLRQDAKQRLYKLTISGV